jgi:lipopolysaccharide/colanic/teichoic acid biosynthesis glycosyltransferase
MALDTTSRKFLALSVKNLFDYLMAGLMLLALSPLFVLVAVATKLVSPGPVFFKQERVGLHGRIFKVYKFRTMVADAEKRLTDLKAMNEMDGPVFKMSHDPRIIPWVGTFLRRTSLDELPQLINIVKGEMSFVGPRPPLAEEVAQYTRFQRRRLSMKPGLTCLWQVAPNRNLISFEKWMKLDLMYIDNWSLFLDLKILLNTVRAVVLAHGR